MRAFADRGVAFGGLLAVLALAALGGCFGFPDAHPQPVRVGEGLWAEYVVSAANHPYALAFAGDGRVFYTEKNTGRIRVIVGGVLKDEPFATVPVNHAGDRGLLGLALHPDFERTPRVYVFYTRSDTGRATDDPRAVVDNRVVYFEAAGDVAAGGEIFVTALPARLGPMRVSGRIAFAADGKLLVGLGDQAARLRALNPTELVGKLLRYNDDGSLPADNPVPGSPVYARGFCDIRGLWIDPPSGGVFLIDRNATGEDEINLVQPGKNYGWPEVTGRADAAAEQEYAASNADYVDPLRAAGPTSPGFVGGAVNPAARYGYARRLVAFYGQESNGRVFAAELNPARDALTDTSEFTSQRLPGTITDVAFTPAGTLYVACRGAIFRITPVE